MNKNDIMILLFIFVTFARSVNDSMIPAPMRDVCPSCDLRSILRIWHGVQIVNYGHNTSGECSQKGADRDILIHDTYDRI